MGEESPLSGTDSPLILYVPVNDRIWPQAAFHDWQPMAGRRPGESLVSG